MKRAFSQSMFILGRTSACQNRVFTWKTIPHSPKTIGMIFTFQGLLTCWSARESVSVLKLYYQRTKIQPVASDGRSSTKVVLPENENPAGRRRRPLQYYNGTSRERKSSQPPATAVPVLQLFYQRAKIQPAAGDGRSSTKIVLLESENPAGRRRRPFQY